MLIWFDGGGGGALVLVVFGGGDRLLVVLGLGIVVVVVVAAKPNIAEGLSTGPVYPGVVMRHLLPGPPYGVNMVVEDPVEQVHNPSPSSRLLLMQ